MRICAGAVWIYICKTTYFCTQCQQKVQDILFAAYFLWLQQFLLKNSLSDGGMNA